MYKWYEDYMRSHSHLPGWENEVFPIYQRCIIRKMKIIHILNGKT